MYTVNGIEIIVSNIDNLKVAMSDTPACCGTLAEIVLSKIIDITKVDDEDATAAKKIYISPIVKNPQLIIDAALKRKSSTSFLVDNIIVAKYEIDNEKPILVNINCDIITNRYELHEYIEAARRDVLTSLYKKGVEIPLFDGIEISPFADIESEAVILSGTKIDAKAIIKKGAIIGPDSAVYNSTIGEYSVIEKTKVTDSFIERDVKIGPYSQVRPNCKIKSGVKIGDFVEIKNSTLGRDTHASHLTYIGDSDVGARVNFGCGTVTSNYDGIHKFRTTIGDDAFIGCNTNLVAPVKVGNMGYTAAGSTITKDVPDGSLAVARARQSVIDGWAAKRKKDK